MKIHYIDILLFALPLNILVNNQRNHNSSTYHTSNTKTITTHRSLCECELYSPSNFEYDTKMNDVIKKFNDRTLQRFEEYNERMQDKRKQCKEQCEKDIQKIILKDKIEKELTEKFATLGTNIDTNDIPTCVCEKSLADKTEKVCLNCGKTMGAVAPAWGLVSGLGYAAWTHYVAAVAAKAATDAGVKAAIKGVKGIWELGNVSCVNFGEIVNSTNYFNKELLAKSINVLSKEICGAGGAAENKIFCTYKISITKEDEFIKAILLETKKVAENASLAASNAKDIANANATIATSTLNYTIIASIVAIVVIVLVMVIIYLILRYRRKKKMKKKLQYIKLLKE
ncbi:surface antigen [Plasmodium falciparum UGT5.1]|uniref:Surface antigen n=1 Tax=Plasmodium falciparum UGT5.1 TaxID=1237627 RepID=W7JCK4_PLAFA|nr:surface antigen [Plasmodium falciparum UGT5.1]